MRLSKFMYCVEISSIDFKQKRPLAAYISLLDNDKNFALLAN